MLGSNSERLNVWLGLNNKFDYREFCEASLVAGKPLMPALIFANKVGMLMCAKQEFPDMEWAEALLAFAGKYNGQEIYYPPVKVEIPALPAPGVPLKQGCCGGHGVPPQPRGVGDTIYKITHATGLGKLAEIYTKITGKPCGCPERQEALNKLFPYGIKEE